MFLKVNPQLLQAPNRKKMKTEFMTNPFRFDFNYIFFFKFGLDVVVHN